MARTGIYRVSALAYYVVMEHSTIFTRIGDVDKRSFHRHGKDIDFPCLLGYNRGGNRAGRVGLGLANSGPGQNLAGLKLALFFWAKILTA